MARVRVPDLLDTFNAIDRFLYQREDAPSAESEYPVLQLPDNGRLRPVVARLVVRSAGADDAVSLRNLANDVARLMRAQPYYAPAV